MNINPFLVLLALLIGFALTWFLVVRKVVREVPILRPVSTGLDAAAGVAGVAGAAGGAGLQALVPRRLTRSHWLRRHPRRLRG